MQPVPTCQLWSDTETVLAAPMKMRFERLETYFQDSHHWRYLLKCRTCDQLYLYEFYEEIDWSGGNDPSWSTWVPVATRDAADRLAQLGRAALRATAARLERDWPRDAPTPAIRKVSA